MTRKEVDGNCEICPLIEEDICPGGTCCYGGAPIEPPCCSIDEDTDLYGWIASYYEEQRGHEKYLEEKDRKARVMKERAQKAAATRRDLRLYCSSELAALKYAKKRLESQKSAEHFVASFAEAINIANEMFRYEERVVTDPKISEAIKVLEAEVAQCEKAYQAKRDEFFRKRKEKQYGEKSS